MTTPDSTTLSEANRQAGKHQVDGQRENILETAERLFQENGIANTSMVEIARAVGITKVTLYRYFANKDEIALQIQIRMLKKIRDVVMPNETEFSREALKRSIHAHLENFTQLQDAYRFIGMFDQIYLDNPADKDLAAWTKEQLTSSDWRDVNREHAKKSYPVPGERSVIMSSLIWFLEKLALRGELTWSDDSVPLEDHLDIFEDMVFTYLDQMEKKERV
ncbi:MAG: TetR/AcrR family transcriptional regulator [Anaerolineae bacterium]|jgi:AcrR family transcriptional regulator|nr:TetR/AcrR family transcriptional regulator [Anaerolineae bacterium]